MPATGRAPRGAEYQAFPGRRDEPVGGDHDRAVMQRRLGVEDRLQHLGGDLAVDAHAGGGVILQSDVALEGDQSAGLLGAQTLGGADRLRDRLAVETRVVTRERTADVPDAAELVQRSAQL